LTKVGYKVRRIVAGVLLLPLLFTGANDLLDLGFFGENAERAWRLALLPLFGFMMFFSPSEADMREHEGDFRDERTFRPLLERILTLWPKEKSAVTMARAALAPHLAGDFDTDNLLHPVSSMSRLETIDRSGERVAILFHDEEGVMHRAVFKQAKPDEWKLSALKSQCPVCLGSGKNEEAFCSTCAGVGWRALRS
jgi:hypothetical protein